VIAADDGPMPQTREHVAILALLGVPVLATVLTKCDRVDGARLAEAHREVEALLPEAPRREVSSLTGAGIGDLAAMLRDAAADHARREAPGMQGFRLAIDRAFTVAGTGTVVTGTVLAGTLTLGDALVLSPRGLPVRVRGLQSAGEAVERIAAGGAIGAGVDPAAAAGGGGGGDWRGRDGGALSRRGRRGAGAGVCAVVSGERAADRAAVVRRGRCCHGISRVARPMGR
jgi:selenocysteine-specific elongation factor